MDTTARAVPLSMGIDFGTNSVRVVLVELPHNLESSVPGTRKVGSIVSTGTCGYRSGCEGVILDPSNPDLARQHPIDYLDAMSVAAQRAIEQAGGINVAQLVVGVGVDTTGSTPGPLDAHGVPLAMLEEFSSDLDSHFWLWKDHTSHAEAKLITQTAQSSNPEYLSKCGGVYSAEWFWSKIFHCCRTNSRIFNAAYTWVECCDYITAVLSGTTMPTSLKRSRCAAGHKAMYNDNWGGLPSKEFLAKLDPSLATLRERLYSQTYTCDTVAGGLTDEWAHKLGGLRPGIPVAVGAIDAHFGAVGSGVEEGKFVKIIGTSTCDICVWPRDSEPTHDIPKVCGVVDGSVLPGFMALEAGQSAVGDIFNWFVSSIQPLGAKGTHEELTEKASSLQPGETGLLSLDWHNGNRNLLVDQRLSGLILGLTLSTQPHEIYRALLEATAFGAKMIIDHVTNQGIRVNEVICCGGIAEKNPLLMQIYADVIGKEMKVSGSPQACALGAAISGAVVAKRTGGGYNTFAEAQAALVPPTTRTYTPCSAAHQAYLRIFKLYTQVHDAFGTQPTPSAPLFNVMKELLDLRDMVTTQQQCTTTKRV
ncbi:ribulose kinase [Pelomyxa schiedti]|nr:ribulose kinase [Pelomyxa schiedti]